MPPPVLTFVAVTVMLIQFTAIVSMAWVRTLPNILRCITLSYGPGACVTACFGIQA